MTYFCTLLDYCACAAAKTDCESNKKMTITSTKMTKLKDVDPPVADLELPLDHEMAHKSWLRSRVPPDTKVNS